MNKELSTNHKILRIETSDEGDSTTGQTPEQLLTRMYNSEGYTQIGAMVSERTGTVGVLVTNESFCPKSFRLSPLPNGYIIGTGNGMIWMMLDLFPPKTLPKAVISLDRDPSVILSGKVLIELARRNISSKEAISYFFGDDEDKPVRHTVDEIIRIASDLASREQNPLFKQVLLGAILKGEFIPDMELIRHLEKKNRQPDIRRRRNITETIYKHWRTITTLA